MKPLNDWVVIEPEQEGGAFRIEGETQVCKVIALEPNSDRLLKDGDRAVCLNVQSVKADGKDISIVRYEDIIAIL